MSRLRAYDSLKKSKDFAYVYEKGAKWHCQGAVVFYKLSSSKLVGFVASKKIGNAVKRAKAKRRMRAVFLELQDESKKGTYLFVAKKDILDIDYLRYKKNIRWSLKKLGCLK